MDRVELAYAEGLPALGARLHGVVRTAPGWVLLDGEGVAALARAARTGGWPPPDWIGRLSLRLDDGARRGQALARARAAARAPRGRLPHLLQGLPRGTGWLTVGHSGLAERTLRAARGLGGPVAAMIHDTIPLDRPGDQRAGAPEAFARRLSAAARHADLLLTPSRAAAADVARHLARLGLPRPSLVPVPLGVPVPVPDPAALPPGLAPPGPYLVALGTIEPRKDHAFLLDLWEAWPEAPPLLILGSRGWGQPEVFVRLDRGVPGVREVAGLPDGAVAALLAGAAALLQPSRAEGFGLPAVEAAALGTPVVCGDTAIVRETLGDRAIVCPLGDRYHWRAAIEALLREPPPRVPLAPPSWADHLKAVLSRIG